MGTAWFLVCCLSGHERRAADDIAHDLQFETFCPQLTKIKMVRGTRTRITYALFQGYAFARFDRERDDWGRINAIDGVLGIYRHENLPVAVPEAEVRTFQRAEAAGVFDLTSSAANFRQGDEVEIEQRGPFHGLIAKVRSAKAKKRVEILLDTLTMSIDPCYLRKVS
jgi:transcription antitermination factor NusG